MLLAATACDANGGGGERRQFGNLNNILQDGGLTPFRIHFFRKPRVLERKMAEK